MSSVPTSQPPSPGGTATLELELGPGSDVESERPRPRLRTDPNVGRTIDDRYVLERVIGEGGMGVVYAGRHRVIEKKVAIKILRVDMAGDNELTERFLQEARSASAIGNAHIVDISDFGTLPDGCTYFVMELLEGKSLSELMADTKGPMPVLRLCSIAKQIAQGLSAAHAANIVHRDLKPDNVMVVARGSTKDFVKILDFGIAKVGASTKRMTRAGSVFGTPHYMSPEQAAGATVDHRTDIYALGVILYEMASAKVPFDADNFMGILTQHMYKAPVAIRALVPEVDVPPGLEAVVLKCLSKKPEGRYESMDELVVDLEKVEAGVMPGAVGEMMARSGGFNVPADYFRASAMPPPVPATPMEPSRRWPLYATIGAVATLLGVVGMVAVMRASSGQAQTTAAATVAPPVALALPTPAPAPAAKDAVVVSVSPADAEIRREDRGGVDLGESPIALQLMPGERVVLVLSRKGYKTKTVSVDGSEAKVAFSLEPVAVAAGGPRPSSVAAAKVAGATPAAPAPPPRLDEVGDPFLTKH